MPIRPTSKQWNQQYAKSISIVAIVCAGLLAAQFWTMENGFNRAFWVVIFFLVMSTTYFLVKKKERDIRAFSDKKKRDLAVARLKLEAEKTAGIALIFAFGLFYQLGFEFDKTFTSGQAFRWHRVHEQMQANMTETFCSVVPTRKQACEAVDKDMGALFGSIYARGGVSTEDIAQRIIKRVRNDLDIPQGSDQEKAFATALATLESMGVSEGVLNFLARCLPIMSVVFGCIAVSSKIAVARVDVEEREATVKQAEEAAAAARPPTRQAGALERDR